MILTEEILKSIRYPFYKDHSRRFYRYPNQQFKDGSYSYHWHLLIDNDETHLELAPDALNSPTPEKWFCWIKDVCGTAKFVHLRYIKTFEELSALIKAITDLEIYTATTEPKESSCKN